MPLVGNTRHSHQRKTLSPDCAEVCCREIVDLLLWDDERGVFDLTRLPPTATLPLRELYENPNGGREDSGYHDSGYDWFRALSNLPGVSYFSVGVGGKEYELVPTLANISRAIGELLGFGPTTSFETLAHQLRETSGRQLRVWSDTLTHRSAATGEAIHHEIAALQQEGSPNAIEIRMRCELGDNSGMAVVSHLREGQQQHHFLNTLRSNSVFRGRSKRDHFLYILSLGVVTNQPTPFNPTKKGQECDEVLSESLVAELLTTPLGCDRRGLRSTITEESKLQEESNMTMSAAVQAICELSEAEPVLATQLLCWILTESPQITDKPQGRKSWDAIHRTILSLPAHVAGSSSLHECLLQSWLPKSEVIATLIRWRLGELVLLDVFQTLDLAQLATFASLHWSFPDN